MTSRRAVWDAQLMAGRYSATFSVAFFNINDLPEQNRVDVDRYGILGQRFLGLERRGNDTSINPIGHRINDRNDAKQAGAFQRPEFS